MGDKESVMLVDLCQAPDEVIAMILKRVPAKELLTACTKVSKQWNRILSQKFFWREKLEEMNGYRLPWRKLARQDVDFYKKMAIKRPFLRNFIRDSWDLTRQDKDCCQLDGRWRKDWDILCQEDGDDKRLGSRRFSNLRIEMPPQFSRQPEDLGPEVEGEPVLACLASSYFPFWKRIVIRLAEEGLTDELMDHYRPTIVVSELVANFLVSPCAYKMSTFLSRDENEPVSREIWEALADMSMGANDQGVWASHRKRFQKGEAECWNLVRHEFKQYPAGMRYLILICSGSNKLIRGGFYGVKLARCSVMALCEGNAMEAEEEEEAVQQKLNALD